MNTRPNVAELRAKAAELKEAKNASKTVPLTVESVDRLDATVPSVVPQAPKEPPADAKAEQPVSQTKKKKGMEKDRLPHGSKFDIEPFDGEKKEWTGTLTVPGFAVFGPVQRSGIFMVLVTLDGLYRKAARKMGKNSVDGKGE